MVQLSLNVAGVSSVSMRDTWYVQLRKQREVKFVLSFSGLLSKMGQSWWHYVRRNKCIMNQEAERKRRVAATDSSLTPTFLELKRAHTTYLSECPQNISLWPPQGSEPLHMSLWRTHDDITPKAQYPPPLLLP